MEPDHPIRVTKQGKGSSGLFVMSDKVVEQELEDTVLVITKTVALIEHSAINDVITKRNLWNLP